MKSLFKLGVVLTVIIVATLTYAEERKAICAWVLWEFQVIPSGGTGGWTINSAFPNYELCMKQLDTYLTNYEKSFKKMPHAKVNLVVNGIIVIVTEEGGKEKFYQFLYKCLPDTVDLRK
jgi:hypothetical protein